MNVHLHLDTRATLGECVLWCEQRGLLYWTDIEAKTLHCWSPARDDVQHWNLPEKVGSFALCDDSSRLLLGLASGIAMFDTESGRLGPVVPVESENPTTRINDGRCDHQGRFVFGMFDESNECLPVGHFYRVTSGLIVERLPLPRAAIANSIAFSPDGGTLYFTDSPTRTIYRCDYFDDGRIGEPRIFVRIPSTHGEPDGSTVDSEGGLWNAQWGGNCVVRYDGNGMESVRLPLPVSQPTCIAFGGANLNRMYITSARKGLTSEQQSSEPFAGGILSASSKFTGLAERRFALAQGNQRK